MRVLACTLTLVMLALLGPAARAAPATLRVATNTNYPPYLYLNAHGRPVGYEADIWHLWEQNTGVKVILEPMQWAAAQAAVRSGQADVIDMLFRTPKRDALYRFSPPYATLSTNIYVQHVIQGIHDPASLRGFLIGVERGDACAEHLRALGVNTLRLYPNYDAIITAARAGVIKMFCMDQEPADYYLYENREQLSFYKAFTLYTGRFHWAVRRGNAATYALVSRGMARISPQERAALRRKWFHTPINFRTYNSLALTLVLCLLAALLAIAALVYAFRRAVKEKTRTLTHANTSLARQAHDLELEKARLTTLMDTIPDAVWMKDWRGIYLEANAEAARFLGSARSEIIGRSDLELFHDPSTAEHIRATDTLARASATPQRSEDNLVAADGTRRTLDVIKVPMRDRRGAIFGTLGVARDITDRKRAERELRIAAAAFDSQDGIMITSESSVIQRVNAAFTRLTGYSAEEAVGQTPRILRSGVHDPQFYATLWNALKCDDFWVGEIWNRRKNGELYLERLTISAVRDEQGAIRHYVGTMHDLTTERAAEDRIEWLTNFDPVTELPNRRLLEKTLAEATRRAESEVDLCGAVMLLGLDNFATVNDLYGHKAGDQILRNAAHRMRRRLSENDLLARFSGDEFAIVLPELAYNPVAMAQIGTKLARTLLNELQQPHVVGGLANLVCTVSIGVTFFVGEHRSAETLLAEAEIAMFKAKASGKNTFRLFEPAMQREIDAHNRLLADLREGIENAQFVLHYQGQVERDGAVRGAEALLRWNHPQRGCVAPGLFIPVAEHSGLIAPIGTWVLREACRKLARWRAEERLRELRLAVNVSAKQFAERNFVQTVLETLSSSGAPADRLELEITESVILENIDEAIEKLNALREAGVHISLDDFGTGSSSLSYITRLPLDQLKIDKSFVQDLPEARNAALVTQSIIGLAQGLGLEVVAEGVETDAQFEFLKAHGCPLFQGYLFGRPVPERQFESDVLHRPDPTL